MPSSKLNKSIVAAQSAGNLPALSLPSPAVFDLPEKVLQFGTGVLLRGLPDYFINKANNQGIFNGRIVVVKSTDAGSGDAFATQDGLYTHSIQGISEGQAINETEVNASISRTLAAKTQWPAVLEVAESRDLQVIISNTTEVGIQLTEDDVRATPPTSFPGKLVAVLYHRWQHFKGDTAVAPVIVPTELVVDNGKKLRDICLELSRRNGLEDAFITWVADHCRFCSSLVDRIVPGRPAPEVVNELEEKLGYSDDLLIMSEVYRLWAIEGDASVKDVLSFHRADSGVIIEPDIFAFRERKLRLLNGTHTISVALGYLAGLDTVGQCMEHPVIGNFIERVALDEIVPAVKVDESTSRPFAKEVLDRFRNPYIVHKLISITLQYTGKMKMRNVQTLHNYVERFGTVPPLFTLGFAAYLLFMRAVRQDGTAYFGIRNEVEYPINDDSAAWFYAAWREVSDAPADLQAFTQRTLAATELWGEDLTTVPGFAEAVAQQLVALTQSGALAVAQQQLAITTEA